MRGRMVGQSYTSDKCHKRAVRVVNNSRLCGSWRSDGWNPRRLTIELATVELELIDQQSSILFYFLILCVSVVVVDTPNFRENKKWTFFKYSLIVRLVRYHAVTAFLRRKHYDTHTHRVSRLLPAETRAGRQTGVEIPKQANTHTHTHASIIQCFFFPFHFFFPPRRLAFVLVCLWWLFLVAATEHFFAPSNVGQSSSFPRSRIVSVFFFSFIVFLCPSYF